MPTSPSLVPFGSLDEDFLTFTLMQTSMENNVPLGRLGDPDEVAKADSFLASDKASYISRTELYIDGGVAQI